MAEDNTYNGWTNYETWNINVWILDDEGMCHHWLEMAGSCLEDEGAPVDAAHALAKHIEQWHEEARPVLFGPFNDMLRAALQEVNWFEIAEHFVKDATEVIES